MLVWKAILNEILAGYSNLGCIFFPLSTLNISCHFLLACRVSAERSALSILLVLIPWIYLFTRCFSLAASSFNILSLCLLFVSLISMCLGVFLLEFIQYGTLCSSWNWLAISFGMLGKFSTIISSKIFSYPLFLSSYGTLIIWMLVHLICSQRSLRLSSVLFIPFTLFRS